MARASPSRSSPVAPAASPLQRLRFTFRQHFVGNALVDKGKLRIERAVPEAKLHTAVAEYDLRVHEWEKQ